MPQTEGARAKICRFSTDGYLALCSTNYTIIFNR